jgi:hypothetical protein
VIVRFIGNEKCYTVLREAWYGKIDRSDAILHNGRVRVVKEFIFLQPLNRIGAIRKEQQKLGYEYTVKASPDTTGCCVRNRLK